jgi:hypothetical protein
MEDVLVNGPINTLRMEGEIYGIKKVLYLFFDIHKDQIHQTRCKGLDSIDINKFIIREFRNAYKENPDKMFDFFLEVMPTDLNSYSQEEHKMIYLEEARHVFSVEHTNKTKILKNVRYHYIDMRTFTYEDMYGQTYRLINQMGYGNSVTQADYDAFMESIDKIIVELRYGHDLLFTNISVGRTPSNQPNNLHMQAEKIVMKAIEKINKKYNHTDLPDKFKDLRTVIKDSYDTSLTYLSEIKDIMVKYKSVLLMTDMEKNEWIINERFKAYRYGPDHTVIRTLLNDMNGILDRSYSLAIQGYSGIVDLFFLRRFLDKDYVQNGVVYTGAAHSDTYVLTLIKYFGFRVTNASYIDPNYTVDTANKAIAKGDYYDDVANDILTPPKLHQCSNVTHFPKNFS